MPDYPPTYYYHDTSNTIKLATATDFLSSLWDGVVHGLTFDGTEHRHVRYHNMLHRLGYRLCLECGRINLYNLRDMMIFECIGDFIPDSFANYPKLPELRAALPYYWVVVCFQGIHCDILIREEKDFLPAMMQLAPLIQSSLSVATVDLLDAVYSKVNNTDGLVDVLYCTVQNNQNSNPNE